MTQNDNLKNMVPFTLGRACTASKDKNPVTKLLKLPTLIKERSRTPKNFFVPLLFASKLDFLFRDCWRKKTGGVDLMRTPCLRGKTCITADAGASRESLPERRAGHVLPHSSGSSSYQAYPGPEEEIAWPELLAAMLHSPEICDRCPRRTRRRGQAEVTVWTKNPDEDNGTWSALSRAELLPALCWH